MFRALSLIISGISAENLEKDEASVEIQAKFPEKERIEPQAAINIYTMKKFYVFGDVHFSSINQWHYDAGENFIKWFEEHDFGDPSEIEAAFVGDIAERDTNPGNVVEQMDRLFNSASRKFRKTYVGMGNHDKKLYHDAEQHSLKFLGNKPNVEVIEEPTAITTPNGFKLLMLPWVRTNGLTIGDYYSRLDPKLKNDSYDVLVGHWNIKEEKGLAWMKEGVDISGFNTKMFAIGHIHNRIRDEYVGSVFPNNVSEQDGKKKGYKVLDENRKETFEEMPCFLEYVTVKCGEPVPERKPNCAYSYVVSDCDSMAQAREQYPDIVIRSIERKATAIQNNSQLTMSREGNNKLLKSPTEAFNDMIKENGLQLGRKTYNLVVKMLAEKETAEKE